MDNSELKRQLSGLLGMYNNRERLVETMEGILYDLWHNWEDKKLLYMWCWRWNDFYISGNKQDAEEFEKFMKRSQDDRALIATLKI